MNKFEKDCKTLVDKFSALAVECEEISYEDVPNVKKKNKLLERCKKLNNEAEILENKINTTSSDKFDKVKKESTLKSIGLLLRRTTKMKKAISSEKIEKEEIRMARECGEVSDESDEDDNEENQSDSAEQASSSEKDEEHSDQDSIEEDNEEPEEGDSEDYENVSDNNVIHEATCNFEAEEEDDLGFQTGELLKIIEMRDDGWWRAENEEGEKGMVPSTYLKVYHEEENKKSSDESETEHQNKRGSLLWSSIRNAVKETSATDVLAALGALPSGFRHSTLGTSLAEGETYTYKNYIKPKLSKSALGFHDLYWDPNTSQIRARVTRVLRLLSLIRCTNIPLPGTGVDVLSRHVRFCLFDGVSILSNIHTIRAKWDPRTPRTWTFTQKVPVTMSLLEEAECFIRSNNTDANMSILFELCVSYVRPSTGEKGELSCGWVSQRLLDDTGLPVPNRTKDLYVNGGTPFEKGVEVDPSVAKKEASTTLRAIISKNRQPRVIFKIYGPSKEQKEQLDLLPDVIIGNMQLLPFFCIYRQLLADALLRDRIRAESSEKIHAPILSTFPSAVDQPDLMDAFRNAWADYQRTEKRITKRDREGRKQMFRKVYMGTIYILLTHIITLPTYKFADSEVLEKRKVILEETISKWKDGGSLSILLAPGTTHKPFSIKELSLDILSS